MDLSSEEDEHDQDKELVIPTTMANESNKRTRVPFFPERWFVGGGKKPTTGLCWISFNYQVCLSCIPHNTFSDGCGCARICGSICPMQRNSTDLVGHSILQKMTATPRVMAYGFPIDLVDDHIAMAESTSILCLWQFAKVIMIWWMLLESTQCWWHRHPGWACRRWYPRFTEDPRPEVHEARKLTKASTMINRDRLGRKRLVTSRDELKESLGVL
jgi:hypothetical protein